MKINTNVMIGLDATMITFLTWIVLLVPAFSEVCPGQFDCEAFNRISCIDYIKVCDSNWDCYGKTDEHFCYAPIVSVPATHSSVTTGNSVTVNCTVFSKLIVTDVYWQRTIGGVISLIKSTTNTNKYSGITANTPSLTIYNADTSDVGTYRCFAANVFGYGNSYPIELFLTEHANITITEFTTEGELVTGGNVTVICRAYVMHKKGPISVVWKMNNSVINPTHSSRWIPEIIQSNHPERWLFRLTVMKMKTSDSGILTCGVSDGLVNAEETLILNVIGKPTVDISPRTLTATLGDIVNINCTVVDSFSVNTSILWYKNGNIFNGNQDESVIRTDQAHTKLVVHGIQNSAQYACSGIDNYGEGDRITSHVTVINPDNVYQYCPINVDQFGGVWGITIENTIAIIPCPGDRTGTTSRLCNGNGDWEEPNYSACISLDLFILSLQSDFLKNGVEVKDSNSILLDLNNLTEPDIRENLTSGELEISSEILDNTAYYAKERTDSLSVDQLEIFVSSCDNLLKENTIPSWEQLKQLNFKGATRIAKAVTVYTKAYTNLNDSAFQRTVQKDQLVVQVGKVFNEDITFPKKTQELPYWITESTNQVTLSKDNFEGEKPVGYSTTYYRNISTLFHQYYLSEGVATKMNGIYDVNSVVIDFSIEPTPNRLQHPLVVKFEHLRVNYSNPVCAFWDFDALNTPNGAWSFSGSKLFKTSDGVTVCQYDHTSNFALLMSPGKATSSHSLVLSKISAAGCIISSIFLVVTVIVHALLWRHLTRDTHGRKLKTDKAMLLVNLCIALTISYVLFVVGITRTDNKKVCTSMAVLLHYIFLVDFACMLAVGIELAIYVLFVFSTSSRTKWLVPGCWVFPAVIVGISVSATKLDGYGNSQYCWLSIESKLIWTFVGPALTVILINFIILMFVMKTTCVANPMQTKKDKTNIQRTKAGIRNLCVIVPLFGVTWVLGVFSVNDDTVVFQYLFAIFNSLQGFFIFVFHTVLDKHVREGIQNMREKKADKSSVYSQKDETKESYVHSTEFDDISKPTTHATGPVNSMANNEYSYQKKTERDNNKEARYSTNQKDILGSIKQYNTKKTKVQNKSRLDKDEQKIQKQEKGKD